MEHAARGARSARGLTIGFAPGGNPREANEDVAVAPGRMNIVGEHTDYNGGWVLPAAIDRHVAVALRLRRDSHLALRSDRYQTAAELDGLPPRRQGNWTDYLVGVAREIDKQHGAGPGFDAFVASDLPVGSG